MWQTEVTEGGLWEGMVPSHLHALWVLGPWVEMGWASEGYQKDDDTCITGLQGTLVSVFH